ncbi:hypothetical protein PybrP1_012875 [[Pythium] brassicae (nom. inval.)]|nr:hypothetical protein PybrP1_012875 [[Pythium] brassicae (nom. inval.)]
MTVTWAKLAVAGALATAAASSSVSALFIDGCPSGTFPVSVLEDPKIHCLSGAPCSGTYSAAGIPQGVGACPANTGCALLPGNEAIMGCVPAGRADVAYVNADGSLTRGGKVVSGPTPKKADTTTTGKPNVLGASNPDSTDAKKADATTTTTTTTTNNNSNNNSDSKTDNASGSKEPSSASATVKPGNADSTSVVTTPAIGSQAANATNAPTPTPTQTPASTTAAPTLRTASAPAPSPTQGVTSQQTLADIDGEPKTNEGGTSATGVGITSIIGIVVGCLAVVAVVAGVRLLKKDKEPVVATPEGGMLDAYGGGITPKENVVLL